MSQVVYNVLSTQCVRNIDANYYTCRNAISGGLLSETVGTIGQRYYAAQGPYWCWRGFVRFDTSGLPADAIITSATIHSSATPAAPDTDFNIIIRGANASYPVILGDYDLTHYNGENLGELTTFGVYTDFTLNYNGRIYINRGGITQFVFLSEEDIDNSPPIVFNEFVSYQGGLILTITYFEPTGIPTVETINLACEDRQSTTLTAVGNITYAGGGYTFRGFEYYEHGADLEYSSSMYAVREIGTFVDTGEFRMTLSGLKPSTVYWIRAFAGNIFGIGYGDWVLCSTIAGSSSTYDVYTEPNTAKYRLYVSDDEAIAWRGYKGPYSGKQTLINIKDITNLTKGMKVLKIDLPEAGKKGNFHICITVKQTLKG